MTEHQQYDKLRCLLLFSFPNKRLENLKPMTNIVKHIMLSVQIPKHFKYYYKHACLCCRTGNADR